MPFQVSSRRNTMMAQQVIEAVLCPVLRLR